MLFNYISKQFKIMQINIKAIQLDDVLANDKIKYNTNNHWDDNKRPEDYDQVISNIQTNKWIDQFRTYKKIIINTKQDHNWMKKAYEIGTHTKRFPKMFDDELEDMITPFSLKNGTDG